MSLAHLKNRNTGRGFNGTADTTPAEVDLTAAQAGISPCVELYLLNTGAVDLRFSRDGGVAYETLEPDVPFKWYTDLYGILVKTGSGSTTYEGWCGYRPGSAALLDMDLLRRMEALEVVQDAADTLAAARDLAGTVQTTDATPTVLLTKGLGGAAAGSLLRLWVKAVKGDKSKVAAYSIVAAVRTNGSAAAVDGTPNIIQVEPAAYDLTVALSSSSNNVLVTVTGVAATTIDWTLEGERI